MRIILKILAAPFVPALTVLWAVMVFIFSILLAGLKIACGLGVLLAIVFFIGGQTTNGIFFLVLSFLISPVGLPLIADWLIRVTAELKEKLVVFITT